MNLTEHFTLAELTRSAYAIRHGINNQPIDAEVLENLHTLAQGLERCRAILKAPIHVNSGYRSAKLNTAIGGSRTSDHMRGLAADIVVAGVDPIDVCKTLASAQDQIGFQQLIHEGTWTHISFPDVDQQPKGEVLTAIFRAGKPTQYVKGIA